MRHVKPNVSRLRNVELNAWRITAVLDTPADLDPGLMREAWAALLARHQALRLFFPSGAGGRREARLAAPCRVASLQLAASVASQTPDLPDASGMVEPLDGISLARGPVAAARFHPAAGGMPGRLVVSVHHLACDAFSLHILGRDLAAICADLAAGGRGELPERSASYAAWVSARESLRESPELAGELAFWRNQLRAADAQPNPAAGNPDRKAVSIHLDQPSSWALLHRSPTIYGVGAETVLLAALAAAAGSRNRPTGSSVYLYRHGRHDASGGLNPSGTVGWLAYRHPLRIETPGLADPWHAAARAGAARNQVPRDGSGYGLLLHSPRSSELSRLAAAHGCDAQLNFVGLRDYLPDLGLSWRVRAWYIEPRRTSWCEGRIQVRALLWAGRIRLLWQQGANDDPGGPRAMLAALERFLAPLMT